MRARVICAAPPGSHRGNRITALRWARILRDLGHEVVLTTRYDGGPCDLMIALHARRTGGAAARFRKLYPDRPLIVGLTGTDVYHDIHHSRTARRTIEIATRLIVLQPLAVRELPSRLRGKTRVVLQSVEPYERIPSRRRGRFDVCVVGHLRPVKDPFRAAIAVRHLPPESGIRIVHAGAALGAGMERAAGVEEKRNARYRWIGDLPHWKARRLIARSRILVLASHLEGGANVVSEAIVCGVPVLSTRIPGSVGLLGEDYPGYFPVGDTHALRGILLRAEQDPKFRADLEGRLRALASRFTPRRERAAWRSLLAELQLGK